MGRAKTAPQSEELRELTYIRKLLLLQLLRDGTTQAEIGAALGIDQSAVSRMLPRNKVKLIVTKRTNGGLSRPASVLSETPT